MPLAKYFYVQCAHFICWHKIRIMGLFYYGILRTVVSCLNKRLIRWSHLCDIMPTATHLNGCNCIKDSFCFDVLCVLLVFAVLAQGFLSDHFWWRRCFLSQLFMVGVLLMFVIQKARLEFDRTLLGADSKEQMMGRLDGCHSCLVNIERREMSQFLNNSHLPTHSYCVWSKRRESSSPTNNFPFQIYHNQNFIM